MAPAPERTYKPVSVSSTGYLPGRSPYPGMEATCGGGYNDNRGAYLTGTSSWHGPMYVSQPPMSTYNPMFVPSYGNYFPYGQGVGAPMMPNPWYTPMSSWYPPLHNYWMPPYQGYWYQPPPMYSTNPYTNMYGTAGGGYPGYPTSNTFTSAGSTAGVANTGTYTASSPVGPGFPSYVTPGSPHPSACAGNYSVPMDGPTIQSPVGVSYGQVPVGHAY